MHRTHGLIVTGIVCAAFAYTGRADAQQAGDISAAANAFSRAQQAELRGDFAEAAELYALADQIAPTPQALRSAASAAHRADMDATAATYAAQLLERDAIDPESRAVAEEILRDTEATLARVVAECAPACRLLIDGRIATLGAAEDHVVYVRPGSRRISATFEGGERVDLPEVALVAQQQHDVEFEASEPEEAGATEDEGGGLSPVIFGSGIALTAIAGGLTIWSGMKVLSAHDDYDRTAPDAAARYDDGQRLELRTNILIGVTSSLAIGTLVLGVLTDFGSSASDPEEDTVRTLGMPYAFASRDGFTLGYTRTFH